MLPNSATPYPNKIDLDILRVLQENARTSNAEIGRRLDLSTSTVFEHIRKLERNGTIRGYETRVDPKALGIRVTSFVFIEALEVAKEDDVEAALLAMPAVQEIHKIAGEDAFLVKIKTADTEALGQILRDGIEGVGVRSVKTTIALATARERQLIPIPTEDTYQ